MKRVLAPSLFIIYPPNSRNNLKGISCSFSPFLLDKRKVGGDSCYPQQLRSNSKHPSQFYHRITHSILQTFYVSLSSSKQVGRILSRRAWLRIMSPQHTLFGQSILRRTLFKITLIAHNFVFGTTSHVT